MNYTRKKSSNSHLSLISVCDLEAVKIELKTLIKKLMSSTGLPISNFLPTHKSPEIAKAWFGNVTMDDPKLLEEVLEDGNIRELTAMITNFLETNCNDLWKVLINPPSFVSHKFIQYRRNAIEESTGVPFKTLIQLESKNKRKLIHFNDSWPSICHLSSTAPPALPTAVESARRYKPDFRIFRKGFTNCEKISKLALTLNDIYPPLSERERNFIGILPNHGNKKLHCVTSSIDRFNLDIANNPFMNYNNSKGYALAGGPSANTRMLLDCGAMMGCNLDCILMACVVSLCIGPQHTPVEIAIATRNDSIKHLFSKVYKIGNDPDKYFKRIAKSLLHNQNLARY